MELVNRFLSYVAVDTQSDEYSNSVPSTEKQKNLARQLKAELETMGLQEIYLDDMGYLLFLQILIKRFRLLVLLLTWIPVLQ